MSAATARHGVGRALSLAALAGGLVLLGKGALIPAKAAAAQVLLDRAFTRSLQTGRPTRPWPWADAAAVARIDVPRLHRHVMVLQGASGQALAFAAAHLSQTPDAGAPGTAVYAAHRDTHFAFLGALKPGDLVEVERIDGGRARFRVDGAYVARANASGLDAHAPGRRLALVTCWPLDGHMRGRLRYIVTAAAA